MENKYQKGDKVLYKNTLNTVLNVIFSPELVHSHNTKVTISYEITDGGGYIEFIEESELERYIYEETEDEKEENILHDILDKYFYKDLTVQNTCNSAKELIPIQPDYKILFNQFYRELKEYEKTLIKEGNNEI